MNVQVLTWMTDSRRQNQSSQCYSVEATERETLAGNGIVKRVRVAPPGFVVRASGWIRTVQGQLQSLSVKLSITGSRSTMPEQNPNSRRSTGEGGTNTQRRNNSHAFRDRARRTSEPRDLMSCGDAATGFKVTEESTTVPAALMK